jgi:putative tryptophan/tyrosine transport system substrate-binding protein
MDRRTWLVGSLSLLAAPQVTRAQPPVKVFRIGILTATNPEASQIWAGFFDGLRELGYVEGQNVVIERRYFGDSVEQLPALAGEMVRLQIDVIVTGAAPEPEAARRATSTIPIVTAAHLDPVGSGLVASLARPGGNVTGLSQAAPELRGKQLQLLKEAMPGLISVAVLSNPSLPFHALDLKELEIAARALKVRLYVVGARAPGELTDAVSAATKERPGALIVLTDAVFFRNRAQLVELAAKSRLPVMSGAREWAAAGGLMTYGVNLRDSFRRAAGYVDRILKGAKPSDLPIERPAKFDLVINLKAAKALGLTIPRSVLVQADQIIQ